MEGYRPDPERHQEGPDHRLTKSCNHFTADPRSNSRVFFVNRDHTGVCMKEKELVQIRKGIYGVLVIIAAVGFIELGLWAYAGYRANQAIDQLVGDMQQAGEKSRARAQAYQQQRLQKQQRQQQKKLDQNTLCAMNTDTNKGVCIHRETG